MRRNLWSGPIVCVGIGKGVDSWSRGGLGVSWEIKAKSVGDAKFAALPSSVSTVTVNPAAKNGL